MEGVALVLPISIESPMHGLVLVLEFLADCDPDEIGSGSLNRVHRVDGIHVHRAVDGFEVLLTERV